MMNSALFFSFICVHVFLTLINAKLFVTELERKDGYKFQCEESAYYQKFNDELWRWKDLFDKWSPEYIDNLTSNYDKPIYYDRIQIFNGEFNYERSDFWRENDYNPQRSFPERYFSATIENILDFFQYIVNTYDTFKYIPNIDFLILGSEYYYIWPSWFTRDIPIFRFENSNEDTNIWHSWLLPSREYVQYWNVFGWNDGIKSIIFNNDDSQTDNNYNNNNDNNDNNNNNEKVNYIPFENRIPKALFRGSVYTHERMRYQVLKMIVNHIDEYDNYFDIRMNAVGDYMMQDEFIQKHSNILLLRDEHKLNDKQQMNYMFVIEIDGSCSPDRVARQLLYGSVIFKQMSQYKNQYYYDLIPYKHFIPWTTPEDLFYKVKYYMDGINSNNITYKNEMIKYLSNVGLNGMKYILEKFNSEYMDCHVINMLHLYANTFKNINLNEVTLKNKIEYNKDNWERWGKMEMNKTIVIDKKDTENYRNWMLLPLQKISKNIINQVDNHIEKISQREEKNIENEIKKEETQIDDIIENKGETWNNNNDNNEKPMEKNVDSINDFSLDNEKENNGGIGTNNENNNDNNNFDSARMDEENIESSDMSDIYDIDDIDGRRGQLGLVGSNNNNNNKIHTIRNNWRNGVRYEFEENDWPTVLWTTFFVCFAFIIGICIGFKVFQQSRKTNLNYFKNVKEVMNEDFKYARNRLSNMVNLTNVLNLMHVNRSDTIEFEPTLGVNINVTNSNNHSKLI